MDTRTRLRQKLAQRRQERAGHSLAATLPKELQELVMGMRRSKGKKQFHQQARQLAAMWSGVPEEARRALALSLGEQQWTLLVQAIRSVAPQFEREAPPPPLRPIPKCEWLESVAARLAK